MNLSYISLQNKCVSAYFSYALPFFPLSCSFSSTFMYFSVVTNHVNISSSLVTFFCHFEWSSRQFTHITQVITLTQDRCDFSYDSVLNITQNYAKTWSNGSQISFSKEINENTFSSLLKIFKHLLSPYSYSQYFKISVIPFSTGHVL